MTWIIKRGRYEYVFAGAHVGWDGAWVCEWTDDQTLAHRFADRNDAAACVGRMPATEERVRIVRLVPRIRRGTP
jgi:hypothetical protein